jgi:hypothetical protein
MGAASSVLVSASVDNYLGNFFPDEIINLVHCITVFKNKIAQSDSTLVLKELGKKNVKDYKLLILALTSRTKSQLQSMLALCNFTNPSDFSNLSSGILGKFFQNLVLSKIQIECRAINIATDGIGCDENSLADIFSCQETSGLLEIMNNYTGIISDNNTVPSPPSSDIFNTQEPVWNNSDTKNTLNFISLIKKKTSKDSPIQKFFMRILKADRGEESPADAQLAVSQVVKLHEVRVRITVRDRVRVCVV